ncbi:MAG: hypothetical protein HYZ71_13610 [Deltaproteobacteria bacterium]|nr:hypothetical protein [Deltaproteobacteria bacterium]
MPPEALVAGKEGVQIQMGKLGINVDYLKLGTKAYVGLIVKRSLREKTASYSLGNYYTIQFTFKVGDQVSIVEDTDLLVGSQVVGQVKKGEIYVVAKKQSGWINLQKPDGTAVTGWLQPKALQPVSN